ncbi:hypothetical protein A9Q90_03385 [Gammaproteobacteria bacterium 54_18_T64]|nr:hypothetical protein A9Q90_03385 [Gammaproteobacteria bacterium 54_18_T64]
MLRLKFALGSLLIITLTLLMIVGLGEGVGLGYPLLIDIWNAGHLVLFALLSYGYFSRPTLARHGLAYRVILTNIVALGLGAGIEYLQLQLGRSFSCADIVNDVIGANLGLLVLALYKTRVKGLERLTIQLGFILMLGLGLRDVELQLWDEWAMRSDFPVLANFETSIQLQRWEFANVVARRSQQFSRSDSYSLEAQFLNGDYPSISLNHLIGDWSGLQFLHLSVYSVSEQITSFELEVFDRQYRLNGFHFDDKFNTPLAIAPGWNFINIPLQVIENAPQQRNMDMRFIQSLSLFTHRPGVPVRLYIDSIRLL